MLVVETSSRLPGWPLGGNHAVIHEHAIVWLEFPVRSPIDKQFLATNRNIRVAAGLKTVDPWLPTHLRYWRNAGFVAVGHPNSMTSEHCANLSQQQVV